MKLVASLIVRNELGRYLVDCVEHLLEFCDGIRVYDDGSDDGTGDWLFDRSQNEQRIALLRSSAPTFFTHEGFARQELLDWTIEGQPTHVLSIDADEFVTDGGRLRHICQADRGDGSGVWTLEMQEVWSVWDECLCVRHDGGWRPHSAPILWRVPRQMERSWRISPKALACGREPEAVRRLTQTQKVSRTGVDVLHFGWANQAERAARHHRYVVADGGRFHASRHLDSILWSDRRVRQVSRRWPNALLARRESLLERANRATVGA